MMDVQLNSWLLFDHAATHHARTEIVSRRVDGGVERYTYATFAARTQQLMHGLSAIDTPEGATVGTLAWNGFRHLEAYFAVPCTGRVLHTINLRLSPEELAYVINHAGDQLLLVDPDLLGLLEPIADQIPSVQQIVVLGDVLPESTLTNLVCYEDLIADQPDVHAPVDIPEQTPMGICYTSGTTGRPKAAVYTHRSTFLHALGVSSGAGFAIGPSDTVLPQVPMFHANAWGSVHASIAVGAKLVLYAGALDPRSFVDLIFDEHVTISAGVPTVWLTVAEEIAQRQARPPDLRHIVCGGSQPPLALINRYLNDFGVPILQAWGMTETSPLASVAWPQARMSDWQDDQVTQVARSQAGLPLPGVALSIRDESGVLLPFDGASVGELHVRGPWVIDQYLNGEGSDSFTDDGWFRTGDVAVGSADGYFVITDRSKDLIKSGGEWISSIDMEAAIMAMPGVAEAAVIAVPDPKWQERPLACLVLRDGMTETLDTVRAHLIDSGFAHWQLPDRVEFVSEIPKTSVGKFDKKVLRRHYGVAGTR
jgi:fatty-acyl-CoA synthase